jgi:hypothetical protein
MNHNVITAPEDLANLGKGPLFVVGPCVHGSIESDTSAEDWLLQPARAGKRGALFPGTEPVYLSISKEIADALKKHKFKDIRLGYDAYIKWLLKQKEDSVLVAGVPCESATWITIISMRGGVIDAINEVSMEPSSHAIFQSELSSLLSGTKARYPDAIVKLSLPGCGLENEFNGVENIGDSIYGLAKGDLNLGCLRVAARQLLPPAAVLCSAVLYAAFSIFSLSSQIGEKADAYYEAIDGIEDEYKRGAEYTRLLEAQRALLTEMQTTSPLTAKVRTALSSLAVSENLLLVSMEVDEKDAQYETVIRFAVLPETDASPAVQAEPILSRLATAMQTNVRLVKFGEDRFPLISKQQVFRTYEVTANLGAVNQGMAIAGGGA